LLNCTTSVTTFLKLLTSGPSELLRLSIMAYKLVKSGAKYCGREVINAFVCLPQQAA
jgi:hypothetical protein